MNNPPQLPPSRLDRIAPALRQVAQQVQITPFPDREVWKQILYDISTNEGWALNELQNWAAILRQVREDGSPQSKAQACKALSGRGIAVAAALLAIDIVAPDNSSRFGSGTFPDRSPQLDRFPHLDQSETRARASSRESPPASLPISVDRSAVGFGNLQPGKSAQARITVQGGPAQVIKQSDLIEVTPTEFGPEGGVLTITVQSGSPGQLLSCDLTIVQDERTKITIDVAARWTEPHTKPSPAGDKIVPPPTPPIPPRHSPGPSQAPRFFPPVFIPKH